MVSGMFSSVINQYSYVYKVMVVVYIFPGEDCARTSTALFQFPYKLTIVKQQKQIRQKPLNNFDSLSISGDFLFFCLMIVIKIPLKPMLISFIS